MPNQRLSPWLAGVLCSCLIAAEAAAQPANDLCLNAEPIGLSSGASGVIVGDHGFATNDTGLPTCTLGSSASSGTKGVWFVFSGTGNVVSLNTCATSRDLVLRVFCGPCGSLLCAASDDDGCDSPNGTAAKLALCTAPGVQYYVLLSRYGGTTSSGGPFSLAWSDSGLACPSSAAPSCQNPPTPPANDNLNTPTPLVSGVTVFGSTIDATRDDFVPSCPGGSTTNSLWYSFVGTGGNITVSACSPDTGANVKITIFDGPASALNCVTSNTSLASCASRQDSPTAVVNCSTPGQTYLVAVSDDSNGSGYFALSLTAGPCVPRPPNDDCTGAITLTPGVTINGTTLGASQETGVSGCGTPSIASKPGVWYEFTPSVSGRYTASTCNAGTDFDTQLIVFRGDCGPLSFLECLDGNNDDLNCSTNAASTVEFCAIAGRPYRFLVSNAVIPNGGNFAITLTLIASDCNPANDRCASAESVAPGQTVIGTTTFADDDTGISDCNGLTPPALNNAVWFQFTEGPTSRSISATTCDIDDSTQFDSALFVFSGSCTAPVCVTANETAPTICGGREDEATVTFCTTPNTTYFIALLNGETSSDGGMFAITLSDLGPCAGGTGVCCRGAACVAVAQTSCAPVGGAGATFVPAAAACNAAGASTTPCCFADYDKAGGIAVADIFSYLNDWFASAPAADFGAGVEPPDVNDIFSYLNAWFAGGC